jgi:hypothetical protein
MNNADHTSNRLMLAILLLYIFVSMVGSSSDQLLNMTAIKSSGKDVQVTVAVSTLLKKKFTTYLRTPVLLRVLSIPV